MKIHTSPLLYVLVDVICMFWHSPYLAINISPHNHPGAVSAHNYQCSRLPVSTELQSQSSVPVLTIISLRSQLPVPAHNHNHQCLQTTSASAQITITSIYQIAISSQSRSPVPTELHPELLMNQNPFKKIY